MATHHRVDRGSSVTLPRKGGRERKGAGSRVVAAQLTWRGGQPDADGDGGELALAAAAARRRRALLFVAVAVVAACSGCVGWGRTKTAAKGCSPIHSEPVPGSVKNNLCDPICRFILFFWFSFQPFLRGGPLAVFTTTTPPPPPPFALHGRDMQGAFHRLASC